MIKYLLSTLLFLLLTSISPGQQQHLVLSELAEVSLLTLGPGEELYSSFGHSALRIQDPVSSLDRIYNFGTFDFNEPGFYTKFVRGKLLYRLSVQNISGMLAEAQFQNRTLTEQTLGLSQAQKQQLFLNLETNALPENRYYRYDFYYDNCSTRLRDAVESVCGNELLFKGEAAKTLSFRRLLDPYLAEKPYADLGMDLGQGMPADRHADAYQSMFLPDYLMAGFGSATLSREGKTEPLVKNTRVLYQALPVKLPGRNFFPPVALTGTVLMLVAGITFWDYRRGERSVWLDVILFLLSGLVGALLLFLWTGTDHVVTARNWNLLWALPTHLPVSFFLLRKRTGQLVKYYLFGSGMLVLLLLLSWSVLPQELDPDLIPFIAALAIRSFYISLTQRKQTASATIEVKA